MIRQVIGYLLLVNIGFLVGWVLRWRLAAAQGTWRVVCGQCATVRVAGPRRQLSIELWDSYGNQYKAWHVGKGEFLDTKAPGPWLYQQLEAEVTRINSYTHPAALALVKEQPDAIVPGAPQAP